MIDADCFREAVLYVAWRTRDDERFGRVKLAKTLFYADFDAYAESGDVVTGATYQHWPFGPFPPALYELESELEREGDATISREGDEAKLVAVHEPATPHLEDWQRQLLDFKMQEIAGKPSWKVSDDSHEHHAWRLTRDKEEIPYEAALVPTRPSREAMEIARRHESRP